MGKCGMLPDYEQMTDEEIARLAQAGDEEASAFLLRKYKTNPIMIIFGTAVAGTIMYMIF